MNPRNLHTQLRVGQTARLKKAHPCGHLVSLPRSKLATVLREILPAPIAAHPEEREHDRI